MNTASGHFEGSSIVAGHPWHNNVELAGHPWHNNVELAGHDWNN